MKHPLVVGYRGEIGSYILNGLIKYMPSATNILCFDKAEDADAKHDRIKKADVIFLCVPLEETVGFFKQYFGDLLGKTVVEQTSLKSVLFSDKELQKWIEYFSINILSMHILFKPSTTFEYRDKTIALVGKNWQLAGNDSGEIQEFIRIGLLSQSCYFKTWESHDKEMALQQAMVHRIVLTLAEMLDRTPYTTYIGKQIINLRNRITDGDYGLYSIIQNNPLVSFELTEFNRRIKSFKLSKYMKAKK